MTEVTISKWDKLSSKKKEKITKITFPGTKKISDVTDRPTLSFATMCKNEEHCIGKTLECVSPYVDYVVVADNGSTDKTFEIVKEFFKETGIPGAWHIDPWDGYAVNKTKMMSYVKGKTDYVLHLDADDFLSGDFSFTYDDSGFDCYEMTLKRGALSWDATVIYNNNLSWRFIGTAHTVIRADDKPHTLTGNLTHKGFIDANGIGSRAFDPRKFWYDGERLTKQFWDCLTNDPDRLLTRSAFYAGQSYMDYGNQVGDHESTEKGLRWYRLFLRFQGTWIEEQFEAQMRISRCLMRLPNHKDKLDEIISEMDKAIAIFDDRAEPYFFLGEHLVKNGHHELGYQYLKKAKGCSLENAQKKYRLFVNVNTYNKNINDWLSVACYYINKIEEGEELINECLNDKTFSHSYDHYNRNLDLFNKLKTKEYENQTN